jgi:hypothetical protein
MKISNILVMFLVSTTALADEQQSITTAAEDLLAQQQKIADIELQLKALKSQSDAMLAMNTADQTLSVDKNWQIKSYCSVSI